MTFKSLLAISAILLAALAGAPANAQTSEQEKQRIGEIVREYLIENPSVVIEALEKYRARQEEQQQQAQSQGLKNHSSYLYSKDRPYVGNPDADVTIIEFFDYNCGYCKRALDDINQVLETEKKVRFVLLDYPILSPSSEQAALWAIAAHKQGKYFEFHSALMKHSGPKNEKTMEQIASSAGLDVAKLRKDAGSSEVRAEMETIRTIGVDLGVMGTPAFIIGEEIARGYIGSVALKEAIRSVREGKKK